MEAADLIGIIGGAIFYLSWVVQSWETKRKGTPTFTAKFFWIRITASFILLAEAIRLKSIGFLMVYIGAICMMFYNLYLMRKNKTKFIQ